MPYYDYRCQECGHILEGVDRRISEDVGTYICPLCGKTMKQLFGTATLEFKGSGFYKTDYQKKSTTTDNG